MSWSEEDLEDFGSRNETTRHLFASFLDLSPSLSQTFTSTVESTLDSLIGGLRRGRLTGAELCGDHEDDEEEGMEESEADESDSDRVREGGECIEEDESVKVGTLLSVAKLVIKSLKNAVHSGLEGI